MEVKKTNGLGGLLKTGVKLQDWSLRQLLRLRSAVADVRGQGTTEYAILVGVLVVIAIIAVAAFKGKLQELWNSIAEGINGL